MLQSRTSQEAWVKESQRWSQEKQQRASAQHNPIKSATTVLSEEQRPESERRRFRDGTKRDRERKIESWLNSQIKEEWVRDVFIHQKLQTPTHGFSSGLSVPRRSLMNWWAEGVWKKRQSPPPAASRSHRNHYHPLKRISQHVVSSPRCSVRKAQAINKSTQPGNFKYHVTVAHSKVREQNLSIRLQ